MSGAGALLYLAHRTVANRLARQLSKLATPRYLLAFLLGVAYLALVVWTQPRTGAGGLPLPADGGTEASPALAGAWLEGLAALGLLALVGWSWLTASDRRALAFSPAEVTWLFAAPVTRRALVHYKLLRAQVLVWLSTALWTLLLARGGPLPPWLRAPALWVLISTLSLHRLGAALVRVSVAERGRHALVRRRAVSVALVAAAVAALGWAAFDLATGFDLTVWGGRAAAGRPPGATGWGGDPSPLALVTHALEHPAVAALLWPFRLLVRPFFATSGAAWGQAMLPALGLLALHYLWVIRADAAFEETAVEASLASARRRTARRASGIAPPSAGTDASPPLFSLAPTGWPATAILWKNLTAVLRRRRAARLAIAAALLGAALLAGSGSTFGGMTQAISTLALTWFGFAFLLGPQWVRNDLRGDLRFADLLHTYPVRGWAILAMEAAASAVTLTLIELSLLGAAYLGIARNPSMTRTAGDGWAMLSAVVVLPAVSYVGMVLQNGAAVLFPAWVRSDRLSAGGIEALGHQTMATLAFVAALAIVLAPAAAVGWGAMALVGDVLGPGRFPAGALVGGVVVGVEAILLLRWLGQRFERSAR